MSSLKMAFQLYYNNGGVIKRCASLFYNPSVRATWLVYNCSKSSGWKYWLLRNTLVALHSIDVGKGAKVDFVILPHPVSIVLGKGVKVASNVTIFQNVTLGEKNSNYPVVEEGSIIYPNCVVVGKAVLKKNCVIGALSFVDRTVNESEIFY